MIKVNKIYILFIISSFIFAYLEGGDLPYAIFYTLIIPFIISFIFLYISSRNIDVQFKTDKNTFIRKEQGEVTEILNNKGYIPVPYVHYTNNSIKELDSNYMSFLFNLNPDASKWNKSRIKFVKRGRYNIGSVSLEFRDYFNIVKYIKNINKDMLVYVYPQIYKIAELNSGGRDIYKENYSIDTRNSDIHKYKDIKKYQTGESLKKIHWKVTAKKGELYSKNNDNVSVNDVLLMLDMNIKNNYLDASKDMEEELVSYFLSVVNYFINEGVRVHVLISNEKNQNIILRDMADFQQLLDYFLDNKSRGTKSIIDFIKSYDEYYQDNKWAGVFTLQIDKMFINGIKEISNMINLFYLADAAYMPYIRDVEKEMVNCFSSEAILIEE